MSHEIDCGFDDIFTRVLRAPCDFTQLPRGRGRLMFSSCIQPDTRLVHNQFQKFPFQFYTQTVKS